jgi:uncharacterized protein YjbJ (UPF0337 family)
MNKNTIEGSAKDLKGDVKRAAGKVTGNDDLQAEGLADKAEGKVQKGIGKTQDAVRRAVD